MQEVKSISTRLPRFKLWLHHLLVVCPCVWDYDTLAIFKKYIFTYFIYGPPLHAPQWVLSLRPAYGPTWNQTCKLLVYGIMLNQ